MNFIDALNWRYAAKQFDPSKKVSDADLDTILNAGNLAATSYGLQPFKFVVVTDQQTQSALVPFSYKQPQVEQASHVIVLAARTDVDEAFIRSMTRLTEKVRDLEQGQLDGYAKQMIGSIMSMSEEQRLQWAQKQIYIALANMMAACAVLKVDSCPMEGFVPAQYDRLLKLTEDNLTATVVLPVGYRAQEDEQQHFAKVRNPIDEMVLRHAP
ncbi:NAD(P)H-dependent oxidoreductase [bacterium]|nr:NAD(P)H-dependent oxidoreductase [bacterium]